MIREFTTGPARVRMVRDRDYPVELVRLVRGARDRVWCSLFIVQLDGSGTSVDPVRDALHELAAARWRGVDTRLLIGGSRRNLLIAESAAASMEFARRLGVPTRGLGLAGAGGSHAKLVIADDHVLTGSHNWSPGAFRGQVQDSVLVASADAAAGLAALFRHQWQEASRADGLSA